MTDMDERIARLEQRLLVMEGKRLALHALLVVFIGDVHLPTIEDPEKGIAELREVLFDTTKDLKSDAPAAGEAILVAAMEQEFENVLGGLRNRVETELRRRRGEAPPRKRPSVLFGSPSGKKPH